MPSFIQRRVCKSGDVSWRVRFPAEDGTIEYRTFPYKWQAEDHLQTLKDARKSGGAVVESSQTLKSFFKEYLEGADIRDQTRADYQSHFDRYIKPSLGAVPLKDLTHRRIQNTYNKLRKALSARSVRLTHSILHSCLDRAVGLRMLRENPSQGLSLPRKTENVIRYLQGEEITEFMRQVKDDKYHAFFIFLLATGVRPSEGRGLRWSDIDFKKKVVHIRRKVNDSRPWSFDAPKTPQARRTLSLPPSLLNILKAHREDQDERQLDAGRRWEDLGLVFTRSDGQPLDRRNLNSKHLKRLYRSVAEKLKLKGDDLERVTGCNMYSLRHSFASSLVAQGIDIKTISLKLGHRDVVITLSTYIHPSASMEKEATMKIEKVLFA